MKKILSIILAAMLMLAISSLCFAADQPEPTEGYEIFPADDFTYLKIVSDDNDEPFVDPEDATNGSFGDSIDNGVQIWVDQGHLWSHHSFAIMPNYYVVIEFDGTGCNLGANFRDLQDPGITVYIDDVETEVPTDAVAPDFEDGHHTIPTRIVTVDGLEDGHHIVKIQSSTACRLSFDWYEIKFSSSAPADDTTAAPADDTTAAPAADDTTAAPAADDTTAAPAADDTTADTADVGETSEGMSKGLLIGIIAAIVVIAVVLVLVLGKKK